MADRAKSIKLFVGNIPYEVAEQDLRNILQGCGNICFINVRKDKHTNRSKGYAHIEYRYEWEAVEAFKRLMGKCIKGRVLKVDFCEDYMRQRYAGLVLAANSAFHTDISYEGNQQYVSTTGIPLEFHRTGCSVQQTEEVSLEEAMNAKRERREVDKLVDEEGFVCNQELVTVIKTMNMLNVANVVEVICNNMGKSPMSARSVLKENPDMMAALIHAKMLLGNMIIEKKNVAFQDLELDAEFDYFQSKEL